MELITLIQQIDVNQKIKNAPDSGYLIRVWVDNILPFAF